MKFTKMHGIGNDYVYVNCFEETVKDPAAVAKFVSDRHFGIGSDGLILIRPSEIADCEIFEDETLRQTLEKMEHRKYSCIPILTMDGKYLGTISEGDLLWGMRRADIHDIKETEGIPIMAIPRRATYKPVHADSNMEDLLDRAINQNFVPVVDDQGSFIGIITRKSIIKYCYNEIKAAQKTAGEEIH